MAVVRNDSRAVVATFTNPTYDIWDIASPAVFVGLWALLSAALVTVDLSEDATLSSDTRTWLRMIGILMVVVVHQLVTGIRNRRFRRAFYFVVAPEGMGWISGKRWRHAPWSSIRSLEYTAGGTLRITTEPPGMLRLPWWTRRWWWSRHRIPIGELDLPPHLLTPAIAHFTAASRDLEG